MYFNFKEVLKILKVLFYFRLIYKNNTSENNVGLKINQTNPKI